MGSEPWVLGVSYSHNGAACLLRGGKLVVAVQEERVSGIKRARIDHYQKSLAVAYCLAHAGIAMEDIELAVACHFSVASPPPATLMHATLRPARNYLAIPHHLGHAHAVFATSGFDAAGVLIVDGQGGAIEHLPPGERTVVRHGVVPGSTRASEVISLYRADGSEIGLVEKHAGDWIPGYRRMASPGSEPRSLQQFGSLGGMFSAVSALIFGDAMEAGKVMGLAPYGKPTLPVEAFFTIDGDGCFRFSDQLPPLFRDLEPWPAHPERYADLAASTQAALEHAILYLARRTRDLSGSHRLCYAGGVALNSVANERVCSELGFDAVHIMPAAEDSGTAIGAAYYGLRTLSSTPIVPARHAHDSVGRSYAPSEIAAAVAKVPHIEVIAVDDVLDATVSLLCDGAIVGWFEGGSELGPRALGQRSILCDARRADGKDVLNERVKHRESFRPFAPVILREEIENWFDVSPKWGDSPYMLRVCAFREDAKARVPAVVHVDGTGRVQTVTEQDNGRLYQLVKRFHQRTGVPIILNTSFNLAGEPIIEEPEDALWCLLATGLDAVVLEGETVVRKQAAYDSLLELYPRVRARTLRLDLPIHNGIVDLGMRPGATAEIVTDTAYGELEATLRPSDLNLLRMCDGTRDGWTLLEMFGRAREDDVTLLARRLYLLRRSHVLSLHAEPI